MLTHYIDLKTIEGATYDDEALLHGRILSTSHSDSIGVRVFDFIGWRDGYHAGKVMRLFSTEKKLARLLVALDLLVSAGAIKPSPIKQIPSDAVLSDYTYKRFRTCKSKSASYRRRFAKRHPDAVWVDKDSRPHKKPYGYKINMLSESTGQPYPLYITRSPILSGDDDAFRIPIFNEPAPAIEPAPAVEENTSSKKITADSAAKREDDLGIVLCKPSTSEADRKNINQDEVLTHVHTVFGENGLLVRDGGHYNPSQLKYAVTVAKSLTSARSDNAPPIGVIEAATGTGKTLGYLIPALLCAQHNNDRVVVSTYTKQLQHQLLNEDTIKAAQYIKEITGKIIHIDRRFGKRNYLSLSACDAHLEHIGSAGDSDIKDFILKLKHWAESKKSLLIPLNNFLAENDLSSEDIPDGLDYNMLAIGPFSTPDEIKAYEDTIKATNNTDLLIVNHAISVINARSWMNVLESNGRKDIYIFDEADKLDDAARGVSHKNISVNQTLKSIIAGVGRFNKSTEGQAALDAIEVQASLTSALSSGNKILPDTLSSIKKLLISASKAVSKASKTIVTSSEAFEQKVKNADFIDSFNELSYAITLIESGAPSLLSASPIKGYPRLVVGQENPARSLARLWTQYNTGDTQIEPLCNSSGVIFTSATITSRTGKFNQFVDNVGINTGVNKATGMTYHNAVTDLWLSLENANFGSMSFVLPDQRIPYPSIESDERNEDDEKIFGLNDKWLSYAVDMIEQAQAEGGRCLVLTNSFKASRELAKIANERNLSHIIEHKKGENLAEYIPSFLAHPKSILVSHGAWEGLNLPNSITHIIIPQIPYAPPNEDRLRLRKMNLSHAGLPSSKAKGLATSEGIDNVVRKLKQGVGRGIRCKTDKVKVWLADPRFPLPDSYLDSFDSVVMTLPKRQRKDLRGFIPKRFLSQYNAAPLFIDRNFYEVEV